MSPLGVSALLPAALIVHALAIVATLVVVTARSAGAGGSPFGGSALASALTTAAAVVRARLGATACRRAVRPRRVRARRRLRRDAVVGVVSRPCSARRRSRSRSTASAIWPMPCAPSRTAAVGVAFNVLIAAVSVVFVVNDVIGFLFAWEIMTLATAALVATEHETRTTPACRVPVSRSCRTSAPAPWSRRSSRWPPRRDRCRSPAILTGHVVVGPRSRRAVRTVLLRLRREGRRDPAARMAAGSASGRAEQHLGADVGRADHGGHLRPLPGLRVRSRDAGGRVGPDRAWGSARSRRFSACSTR